MNKCETKPALWPALFLALLAIIFFPAGRASAQQNILTIFHTTDIHGHALAEFDDTGAMTVIGYPVFKAYVDSVDSPHKMLLDAGDILHGQPFATVKQGGYIARILADLKYDALVPGNHDFNYGLGHFQELARRYELNFISANISGKEDGTRPFPPYVVKQYGSLKVAVFGLTTPETVFATNPGNVATLNFGNAETLKNTARELTEKLRREEKADLVVALTHLGVKPQGQTVVTAREIAEAAPDLDLIVDGHAHQAEAGLKVGKTLIVSAGYGFHNIGRINISRNAKGGLRLDSQLVTAAEASAFAPDPGLDALTATMSAELDRELNQVVATLPFALEGDRERVRGYSTNLGRLVCAAVKRHTGADVAIMNSGNLRAGLPAGDITRGQLLTVMPFNNYILTVKLDGKQLMAALETGLKQVGGGGFPQFYGMTVTAIEVRTAPSSAGEVKSSWTGVIEIGGREIDPEAIYTVAINDFMYEGGDGYTMFPDLPYQKYGTAEEIFLQYLTSASRESLEFVNSDDVLTILIDESDSGDESGDAAINAQ